MIKSMTGYGKTVCELPKKTVNIEIRSLNSKQLDINIKSPTLYRENEPEIRNRIGQLLSRGKIDFTIYIEVLEEENIPSINREVVYKYYHQLAEITGELKIESNEQLLAIVMQLPDTLKTEKTELEEEEWEMVYSGIEKALENLNEFREKEGKALEKDMIGRTKQILHLLQEIEPYERERINKIGDRIRSNVQELLPETQFDENRFEQEIIYHLEKLDISEEKLRLKTHCDYFIENTKADEPIGKKLGFITQEMGREINTLGSKANDADIQKLVVRMKDELEKIKEQIVNVL